MYEEFLEWAEEQGLEFPCTANQFCARAAEFAAGDVAVFNALCERGIGADWKSD